MDRRMVLYRGSLKSCNYRCSYCPFSKHPMTERELSRDKQCWLSFVESYKEKAAVLKLGALLVVPYGEALLHPWYREGLAHISALSETDAVGAQTNLSFSVEEFLRDYRKAGGVVEKLHVWATFHPQMIHPQMIHPQMTEVSAFAGRCRELRDAGAHVCAGCVGVPENVELIRELREKLSRDIYLWINKMDGLRRAYTQEEREAFSEIDPFFYLELTPVPADPVMCRGRLFVEGDGRLRTCNISPVQGMRWEELVREEDIPEPVCARRYCSCYLAYGGREDFVRRGIFGGYPLFRVPRESVGGRVSGING